MKTAKEIYKEILDSDQEGRRQEVIEVCESSVRLAIRKGFTRTSAQFAVTALPYCDHNELHFTMEKAGYECRIFYRENPQESFSVNLNWDHRPKEVEK